MDSVAFGTALDTWDKVNKYLLSKGGIQISWFYFNPKLFLSAKLWVVVEGFNGGVGWERMQELGCREIKSLPSLPMFFLWQNQRITSD